MPKLLIKNALTKCWFVDKMLILEWGTWRENADLLTICGKVVGENEEILWGWGIYWQLLGKKWEICWFLAQIFPTFSLSITGNPAPAIPTTQLHTHSVIRSPREKAERVWLCGTVGGGDIDMQGKDGLEVKGEKPHPERERGSIGWLVARAHLQSWEKVFANLAKQHPGRTRQKS